MSNSELTPRDEEYLRTIFLLEGKDQAVSPTRLGRQLGISKVSAYQKLRRLELLGAGSYLPRKGFLLNTRGLTLAQGDIHRHHILEKFFQDELGFSSEEACRESARMGPTVSTQLLESISDKLGDAISCDCGCCLNPPYEPGDLVNCHWCKMNMSKGLVYK